MLVKSKVLFWRETEFYFVLSNMERLGRKANDYFL